MVSLKLAQLRDLRARLGVLRKDPERMREFTRRLFESLAEEVEGMTDEEVLRVARETGLDTTASAERLRAWMLDTLRRQTGQVPRG